MRISGYRLLNSGFECNSDDVFLDQKESVSECANTCRQIKECNYFIFGNGIKTGKCYWELTEDGNCLEGWERDHYDFYEVLSTFNGYCIASENH